MSAPGLAAEGGRVPDHSPSGVWCRVPFRCPALQGSLFMVLGSLEDLPVSCSS